MQDAGHIKFLDIVFKTHFNGCFYPKIIDICNSLKNEDLCQ